MRGWHALRARPSIDTSTQSLLSAISAAMVENIRKRLPCSPAGNGSALQAGLQRMEKVLNTSWIIQQTDLGWHVSLLTLQHCP